MCFLFKDRGERRSFWVDGYMVYGNTEFDLNEKSNKWVCLWLLFWKDTWSEPPWTHLSPAASLSTEYWGQFVGAWNCFIPTKRRKMTSVKTMALPNLFRCVREISHKEEWKSGSYPSPQNPQVDGGGPGCFHSARSTWFARIASFVLGHIS